jgi:hypothetical protein
MHTQTHTHTHTQTHTGVAAFGGLSAAVGMSFGAVGAGLVGYKVTESMCPVAHASQSCTHMLLVMHAWPLTNANQDVLG